MSSSQAFAPPRELARWVTQTKDLLKSIERSGQVANNSGPDSVSAALALAAVEITHGMLIMVGLSLGRTVANLREELPTPEGWRDAS